MNHSYTGSQAQIEPIPKLPIFLDLAGRRAVLAGNSPGLAWKAELIASAGADVRILAPEPSDAVALLKTRGATGAGISVEQRPWRVSDLAGAAIAVADLETEAEAAAFHAAGRAAGVIVNTIDKGATCDFYFGAIVSRAPIVIGITTDGTAPILGQAIRRLIELALPVWLGDWASLARSIRPEVKRRLLPGVQRRAFWEGFVERALAAPLDAGSERVLRNALDRKPANFSEEGRIVTLLPPHDVDDLTLRDVKRLQSADVIIHDADLIPGVFAFFRREATRLTLCDSGTGGSLAASALPQMLADLRGSAKSVVVIHRSPCKDAQDGAMP